MANTSGIYNLNAYIQLSLIVNSSCKIILKLIAGDQEFEAADIVTGSANDFFTTSLIQSVFLDAGQIANVSMHLFGDASANIKGDPAICKSGFSGVLLN